MPSVSRKFCRQRLSSEKKCSVLRFLVIILSLISLFSRIIYSTYASWLVFTTYHCIQCPNTTASNESSGLFISHHSSAIIKTIRSLNIESAESHSKARIKRSLREVVDNYSKFLSTDDSFAYYETKQKSANLAKEVFDKITLEWLFSYNQSKPAGDRHENTTKLIQSNAVIFNGISTSFSSNETQNEDEYHLNGDSESDSSFFKDEQNLNDSLFLNDYESAEDQNFEDMLNINDENLSNKTFVSKENDNNNNVSNTLVIEWKSFQNQSENDMLGEEEDMEDTEFITMTIILNEEELNETGSLDSRRLQKSMNDYRIINDTSYVRSRNNLTKDMTYCSEECATFLSVELNDPKIRKWAMILMTSVMYLYALVMLCILIGACFLLPDMLIIATFIEGAKLFAAFIFIIIHSFNGKQVHFNLVDVKFNVNTKGNGWTADFAYSEYLLDIIIFLLSTFLCFRVFKRCRKVSSTEEFANRGTYRERDSSGLYPQKC